MGICCFVLILLIINLKGIVQKNKMNYIIKVSLMK